MNWILGLDNIHHRPLDLGQFIYYLQNSMLCLGNGVDAVCITHSVPGRAECNGIWESAVHGYIVGA